MMSPHGNSPDTTVLLGGSFNPPHLAHLLAAGAALAEPACAEVWLVPCASHPFEKELLPFAARAALCRAMIARFEGRVSVCEVEAQLPEPSYTVRTLDALKSRYPERRFAWLIGSDNVAGLPKWKDAARLHELADIWVAPRGGEDAAIPGHLHVLPGPPLPAISSTSIRAAIAAGKPWRGLVQGDVAAMIEEEGYYR